jgi:hypothetical protein
MILDQPGSMMQRLTNQRDPPIAAQRRAGTANPLIIH